MSEEISQKVSAMGSVTKVDTHNNARVYIGKRIRKGVQSSTAKKHGLLKSVSHYVDARRAGIQYTTPNSLMTAFCRLFDRYAVFLDNSACFGTFEHELYIQDDVYVKAFLADADFVKRFEAAMKKRHTTFLGARAYFFSYDCKFRMRTYSEPTPAKQ